MYTENDWRDYLAHSWGKKPDQKAAEKKYNHEYWEEHKEEIMKKRQERDGYDESKKAHDAAREKNGEKDYEGKEITDEDSMDARLQEELEYIKKMIEANGGYSEGDMANITKHNEYIMANLTDLVKQAKSDASGMDADQKAELFKKINEQMNKAHELILDTSSKTSQDYLSNIGIKGTGTSKSSGGGSSKASESKSEDSEDKEDESKSSSSSGGSKKSTPEENRYNFERQRAVREIERSVRNGDSKVLESDDEFEKAARRAGFNTEDSEEYKRMRRMMRSEDR